ncbi:integral membrane protein [Geosmithia morbida]|uniref:Integral membrane protein n=1 Tax=Geosmithia morbida TaxID=1094350 RepID=A0A9P4Z0V1_9HYPO|nr:uncharacterized protein GMORB2_0372 [Geosmithia morbida]KAF4126636.1 integral membrane protein [Geosmithia morbida]
MSIYSDPPPYREFRYDKPTLLVCWWATILCACIIVLRIAGRFVRTERLFTEDRIAALALIPLFLRMACVHFILVYGTNNVDLTGIDLSPEALRRKEIASGLVLLSRILYAATIWILKNTILEFFRRLTDLTWERSYHRTLVMIRWVLVLTFLAVIISDLAECRPFNHYWQVTPDPGPRCRQGYAQLITTATCNIVTDLLLVFFPIPIILRSHMKVKRKIQLTLLFSLSLAVVGITLYRVPHVIDEGGRQQYRSLLASVELIFATAAANALVLGSFVRDRGLKKQKFRQTSLTDSLDRRSDGRRPALHHHWGSDEDLVRDVGIAIDPELQSQTAANRNFDAWAADPSQHGHHHHHHHHHRRRTSNADRSDDLLLANNEQQVSPKTESNHIFPRRVSFFDVGGLLEQGSGSSSRAAAAQAQRGSPSSSLAPPPPEPHPEPSPSLPAASNGLRRGSTALLQDLGGLLDPRRGSSASASQSRKTDDDAHLAESSSPRRRNQTYNMHGKPDPILQDPGGLLD